jgi:beta-galactosidase/beta-glucuronidase
VTRAHYLLNDRLLSRLDRAGIMVWNEAPIWQRDRLLRYPSQRRRAWLTVRRTVKAGRNHPSVITHSVANELSFTPDRYPGTRSFLTVASKYARDLDPTLPVTVDIKGGRAFPSSRPTATSTSSGSTSTSAGTRGSRTSTTCPPGSRTCTRPIPARPS